MTTKTAPTPKTNGSVQRAQTAFSVLRTNDYDKFKLMPNNRHLNLLHVKRLVESFNQKYLVSPITINEKFEIIDGQHRLRACRETGNPIYYITVPGYGINEVQLLNTNQKNWQKMDWLHMYCAEEREPYLELRKFMTDFPDFGIQPAERIIRLMSGNKTGMLGGTKIHMRDFEEGKLIIPNLQKSYSIAKKIMDIKPFFKDINHGTFVSALLPLLIKSKVYDHKEMIHKLSNCPIKLIKCNDVAAYRMLLEDIYNYKRLKENKVSFRYE